MALVRNFKTSTANPNTINLNWDMPLNFNDSTDEIIVTRTISHYPVELYNVDFPTKATDSRPIEIFRGQTIAGINTGTISVATNTLTDTAATFPNLIGRLVRDSSGEVFKVLSNTSTSMTFASPPVNGKYVVLPDFPTSTRDQQSFEVDIRTTVGLGFIKNLVQIINGNLLVITFVPGELANLVFKDGANTRFIIKNNTADTIFLYETGSTPVIGNGLALLPSFANGSTPSFYLDNFKTDAEAAARVGTGLLDNTFYYYTAFNKPFGTNVAQATYGSIESGAPTQSGSISIKDRNFGTLLYNLWPSLARELDATEDLEDLMKVFAFQFGETHSIIDTYHLQDSDQLFINGVLPLSEQTGLPSIGFAIGGDTLRRVAKDLIGCWRLKGSKEGIAYFIKMITTWDVTNGTGDFSGAIQDFLPNITALRFFDQNLGSLNTRITQTDPIFVAGGRFAKSLPGVVIPGFFTFREFVVTIPNVALYIGSSQAFTVGSGTTTMTDANNNYGAVDSLKGNFLLPNQEEINDIFEIVSNTATTITVRGIITNKTPGGDYAVLSPLNTNRFIILNKLLPFYIPFKTKPGFTFT